MKYQFKLVQILRGFAALSVLIYHLDDEAKTYLNHVFFNFNYGYLGVDFFFALSGFIITYVHLKDIKEGGSLKAFVVKRLIRIYPLYWIVFCATFAAQFPLFEDKPGLSKAIDPHTFSGWIVILKNLLLVPIRLNEMPVGVAWTLVYEMAFYTLFAILIKGGWKMAKIVLAIWVLAILICSRDIFPKNIVIEVYAGSKIIEFLLGCVAAYVFLYSQRKPTLKIFTAMITAIALLFYAYLSWHLFNPNSIAMTILMGALASILIFYSASLDKENKYKGLSIPFLVLLGDASYAIYLTHTLLIILLFKAFNKFINIYAFLIWEKNILIITIGGITVIAGILIHLRIEKPLLKTLRSRSKIIKLQKSGSLTT